MIASDILLTLYWAQHSNGPLYSNAVIGTLAVDEWAATFGTGRTGLGAAAPPSSLRVVPNVTAQRSTASVPASYYSMWHYNCMFTTKG